MSVDPDAAAATAATAAFAVAADAQPPHLRGERVTMVTRAACAAHVREAARKSRRRSAV